jgi:hypothetical protein
METQVKLAENGTDIKADRLSLLSRETGPVSDFRRGAIFIAISIPVTISRLIIERYEWGRFTARNPFVRRRSLAVGNPLRTSR